MRLRACVPLLMVLVLACSLLNEHRRPPRASREEAEQVEFSLFPPRSAVTLDVLKLRAAAMATEDYFAELGNSSSCYEQEGNYEVTVWMAESVPTDGGCPSADGGFPQEDGGYRDVGLMSGVTCETLYGTPGLVYVAISLRPGACSDVEDGGEIVLDVGGIYAIDVKKWRIAAAHR